MFATKVFCDRNLGLLQLRRNVTVSEVKNGYLEILQNPALQHDTRILTDAREVTDIAVDFPGMLMAVLSVKHELGRLSSSSRAILMVHGETHFGIARMFEQVVDSVTRLRMRVVQDPWDAARALRMSEAELTTILAWREDGATLPPLGTAG